jgi:hypothetical protein
MELSQSRTVLSLLHSKQGVRGTGLTRALILLLAFTLLTAFAQYHS